MPRQPRQARMLIACAAGAAALLVAPASAQELQTINVMTSNDTSCSP